MTGPNKLTTREIPWFAGAWPFIALAIASAIIVAELVYRCGP